MTDTTFRAKSATYAHNAGLSRANVLKLEKLCGAQVTVAGQRIAFGDMDIAAIRQSHIHEVARTLFRGRSASTMNREAVTPAAAVIHYFAEEDDLPYRRIRRFKEDKPLVRLPEENVMRLLLANTEGMQRLLLGFLIHQGWRISETLAWQAQHRDMQGRSLTVWVPKARAWKTLAMHDEMFLLLANADLPDLGSPWPWTTRDGVYRWLRPLCKRLGVTFTPHMARHAFATDHDAVGADNETLVNIGTWTSPKSVGRYRHAGMERKRAAINARSIG